MSDLEALLKAIIVNPDADVPRLMYADALEEIGGKTNEARAQFIRAHCLEGSEGFYKFFRDEFYPIPAGWAFWDWHKGFIESFRCSAEDFIRHADALIWHPSQNILCHNQRGSLCGVYVADKSKIPYGLDSSWNCPLCGGTGRIPRPCPPTAQPIRKVVLTTVPSPTLLWDRGMADYPMTIEDCMTAIPIRWPSIEFDFDTTNLE